MTKGLQEGRELVFEQAEVNIGRTSENDVVLHDHGVSRQHARIVLRDGQYFAEDIGSSNGTALNGTLLKGEKLLRDGDRIGVGPVEFTFLWVPPDGDVDATRPIRRVSPQPSVVLEQPDQEYLPTGELPAVTPVAPSSSNPPSGKRPLVAPAAPLPIIPSLASLSEPAPPVAKRPSVPPVPPVLAPPPALPQEDRTEVNLAPVVVPVLTSRPLPPPVLPLEEHTEVLPPSGARLAAAMPPVLPVEERTEVLLTVSPALRGLPLAPPVEERTDVLLATVSPPIATAMPPGLLEESIPEERTELALPTLAAVGLLDGPVDEDSTRPIVRLAKPAAALAPMVEDAPTLAPPPVVKASPAPGASAADRARERRELARSRGGQLVLGWRGLSLPRKLLTGAVLLLVLGGVSVGLAAVFLPGGAGLGGSRAEPMSLGLEAVTDSFGLGEGVRWEHPDQKSFEFQFVAPTRAVALLHYQASGVSKEEVALVLNGVNLGWVPPDTTTTAERELEHILPASALKRGVVNTFAFDNVRNPPGSEAWRVWNLRLEIIPVPELPPEQLLEQAREYASTGRRFFDSKGVGAENLFRAWQQFRFAWITLEALDTRPELYEDVRYQLSQVSSELDHQCAQLMLEFQRSVQFRSAKKARAALQEVSRRFPTTEHRCHNLAKEKAFEHEL
ncbi:FHA domain-containing protein [Myxococcus fulvus]|uniref:FHA domain-containing protein n=1 Tax=Myxococcus fulvus TaxID=33 RepID=UPI003B99F780